MQRFISTFSRSGGLLVFLVLEAICLVLVVNFNEDQKAIYDNSSSLLSNSITHGFGEITQYYNLSSVNDSLAGVIADLREEQDQAKFEKSIWRDSLQEKRDNMVQQYTYTAAKVVSNTITLPNNYLTLDRGRNDGIDSRMGVFDDRGIVGIVVASNSRYSKVMSILHQDSKISAEIKRLGKSGAFGSLVWKNTTNSTMMDLENIPKHFQPEVGDTIQTDGFSTHFPKGRMIGTIAEISDDNQGSSFHTIKVKLSNDLSTTRYVYIVDHLFKEEFTAIQEGKENE